MSPTKIVQLSRAPKTGHSNSTHGPTDRRPLNHSRESTMDALLGFFPYAGSHPDMLRQLPIRLIDPTKSH